MAETVIELDLSSPWEPPDPPRGRPGPARRLRWVAVCAVVAVVAAGPSASGVAPSTGPLYRIDHQVRSIVVAGGMLFVGRYQQGVSDPRIEGRRRSDGTVLWSVPVDLQHHYVASSAGALILVRHGESNRGFSSTLIALDPATGRQLWTRPQAALVGTRDDLVVVEDLPDQDEAVGSAEAEAPDATDPETNHAGWPLQRQLFALDAHSGAEVWRLTTPPGSALDFAWDGRYPTGRVTALDQLDPSGLVTRRDVRTGAVVATRQLDWSGTPAMLSTGPVWPTGPANNPANNPAGGPGRTPGRAVVYPDGQRGGIVFDLADGRALFRTDAAMFDGLYQCTPTLFCTSTGAGIAARDGTTGRSVWRLGGYTEVVAVKGDRLVVGTHEQGGTPGRVGVADARTGAVLHEVTGWQLILGTLTGRILLWRPVDIRTALLGELDPATGGVTVFGRADDWYGAPECSEDAGTLACVMVGTATVWRLPDRRR
ncbi:PQQ-binding-like beta-propeller repeat protein [Dactylosporangium sp. NPDC050688]|uniref:outer membrane protein assembly factor BamB family protein n=1 Tax=Dactylosporangium sp. NPDC050688 TaxID=3157217 RepID=UPI0033D16EDF